MWDYAEQQIEWEIDWSFDQSWEFLWFDHDQHLEDTCDMNTRWE